jgi:hypothetical protein
MPDHIERCAGLDIAGENAFDLKAKGNGGAHREGSGFRTDYDRIRARYERCNRQRR